MDEQELVGMVIITHNRCELLEKCINSVIETTVDINKFSVKSVIKAY